MTRQAEILAEGRRERPILFSSEMVRAILDGRKTQTRRAVDISKALDKKQRSIGFESSPENATVGDLSWVGLLGGDLDGARTLAKYQQLNVPIRHPDDKATAWDKCGKTRIYCPYGHPALKDIPATRLWVKETWATPNTYDCHRPSDCSPTTPLYYHADQSHGKLVRWTDEEQEVGKTRPSIFMPRWASRLTLEITEVRVQRLQDISEEDAEAEGIQRCCERFFTDGFVELWESIHGPGSWDLNPWIWALSFKPLTPAFAEA